MPADKTLILYVGENKPLNIDMTNVILNTQRTLVTTPAPVFTVSPTDVTVSNPTVSGQVLQAWFDASVATAAMHTVKVEIEDDAGAKHIDSMNLDIQAI